MLETSIDTDTSVIAELDGKPVGVCLSLPNFNEASSGAGNVYRFIRSLKAAFRKKSYRIASERIASLGVAEDFKKIENANLAEIIFAKHIKLASEKGYTWGELSLVPAKSPST